MKITIRGEAVDDLEAVAFAWLVKDNPAAAVALVDRLRERITRLSTPGLSHMGRFGTVQGYTRAGRAAICHRVSGGRAPR